MEQRHGTFSRILLVEDEPKVSAFIKTGLESSGFEIEIALDGLTGRGLALSNEYDCIILDITLPNISGLEICKQIRGQRLKTPVIIISALGSTDDKLRGFDSGADDYLVKPFEFSELNARVKSLINRSHTHKHSNLLKIADLVLNLESKIVTRGSRRIELTAKEFLLLEFLLLNQEKIVSKVEIADKVWGIKQYSQTNVIEVYINFLRKKIDKRFSSKLIHTHVGIGYELKEEGLKV